MAEPKTINELLQNVFERAGDLANQSIDDVRAAYPVNCHTRAETIRYCKEAGYSRGDMIQAILDVEFENDGPLLGFDFE